MNLISRENNNFEILVETLDDLWILSQFIKQNDRLFGTTERKVKIGSDVNYKVVKKLIFVELSVTGVKYENDILRVAGKIQNETEFTAVGASHSLTFKLGDKIKFEKKDILKYEEKLIKNAINSKNSHNLLILLDKDTVLVSEFSDFSYRVLFEKGSLGSKKYKDMQINDSEEKFKLIEELLKKDYSNVVLAGPSLFKDKLQKYIKDKIGKKTITFHCSDVTSNAIQKVIKKIQTSGILGDSQIAKESKYMSILLENINKNTKFAYGQANTFESVNIGSIENFLISTKFINEMKENNKFDELNIIMKTVEQLNGELIIVNSKNDSGKILDGLGGIAGILRY